jgi:hypothetical protein
VSTGRETVGQKLQGDVTEQLRVASAEHDAHPALAERGGDFVWTNTCAWSHGHYALHYTFDRYVR